MPHTCFPPLASAGAKTSPLTFFHLQQSETLYNHINQHNVSPILNASFPSCFPNRRINSPLDSIIGVPSFLLGW
jgi:hypothetical protein